MHALHMHLAVLEVARGRYEERGRGGGCERDSGTELLLDLAIAHMLHDENIRRAESHGRNLF